LIAVLLVRLLFGTWATRVRRTETVPRVPTSIVMNMICAAVDDVIVACCPHLILIARQFILIGIPHEILFLRPANGLYDSAWRMEDSVQRFCRQMASTLNDTFRAVSGALSTLQQMGILTRNLEWLDTTRGFVRVAVKIEFTRLKPIRLDTAKGHSMITAFMRALERG